ncbi:hypothetical protein Tco_0476009 [Tanacetum coccineum]
MNNGQGAFVKPKGHDLKFKKKARNEIQKAVPVQNVFLLEPSFGGNPTLSRSSSRHSTLEADQINHQFLGADNGSSPSVYSIPDNQCTFESDSSFIYDKQDLEPTMVRN